MDVYEKIQILSNKDNTTPQMPATVAEQVTYEDGKNAEAVRSQLEASIADIQDFIAIPFEGSSGDVAANSGNNFYINYSLPSGYEQIGAVINSTNGLNIFVFWIMSVSNTQVRIGTFNHRTSSANLTLSGYVLAKRSK